MRCWWIEALAPIVDFARMLKDHWDGVVRWLFSGLTNGLLESLNSLIQPGRKLIVNQDARIVLC